MKNDGQEIYKNAAQHHFFANPTNIANANPTPPTPADRVVPVNGWPLDRRTLWAGFAWFCVRLCLTSLTNRKGDMPRIFKEVSISD